jgi:hypothetical protein
MAGGLRRRGSSLLMPPVPSKRASSSGSTKTALGDSKSTNVDIPALSHGIKEATTIVEVIGPRKSPRTARLVPPRAAVGPHRTSALPPNGSLGTQKGNSKKQGTPSKPNRSHTSATNKGQQGKAAGNATPRPSGGPALKQKSKSFAAGPSNATVPLPTAAPTTGSSHTSGKLKMKLNDEDNPFIAPASKSKSTTALFSKKKLHPPSAVAPTPVQTLQKGDKRAEVAEKLALLKSKFASYSLYLQGLDATTKARLSKRIKELGGVIILFFEWV